MKEILKPIAEKITVIQKAQTIADQVLQQRAGSVITAVDRRNGWAYDVLMRTGRNGWLTARPWKDTSRGYYLKEGDVRAWVDSMIDGGKDIIVTTSTGKGDL